MAQNSSGNPKKPRASARPRPERGGSAELDSPHGYVADGSGNAGSAGHLPRKSPRGKKNLFVDDGTWDGTGQGENPPIEFPASTIETADEALLFWLRAALKGDTRNLQNLRVLFATGERWALNKSSDKFTNDDGVPILPLAALVRQNVVYGKEAERASWSATDRFRIQQLMENSVTGKRGKRWIEMAMPVPFQIRYSLEFWTRSPIEMNEALGRFVEVFRNRNNLETIVTNSNTGWPYSVKFDGSLTLGENIEDYTGSQRIVRSVSEGTLMGYHINSKGARARTLHSFHSVSFKGQTLESNSENDPESNSGGTRGAKRGSDALPLPTPDGGYQSALDSISGPLRGNSGGDYRDRPRKRHKLIESRPGERIFKLDD